MEKKLELYGASWCLKSAKLRNYLQSQWIEFDDHDVEDDAAAAERVKARYEGVLKFPTVIVGDEHLKNPTIQELDAFLEKHGIE